MPTVTFPVCTSSCISRYRKQVRTKKAWFRPLDEPIGYYMHRRNAVVAREHIGQRERWSQHQNVVASLKQRISLWCYHIVALAPPLPLANVFSSTNCVSSAHVVPLKHVLGPKPRPLRAFLLSIPWRNVPRQALKTVWHKVWSFRLLCFILDLFIVYHLRPIWSCFLFRLGFTWVSSSTVPWVFSCSGKKEL